MCAVQCIAVVHDHEIVMHYQVPCLAMPLYASSAANVMIVRTAQWEQEGERGYARKPAGTGPSRCTERQLSRDVLDERAPTPHWKAGVMDGHARQRTWPLEEPTRVAPR